MKLALKLELFIAACFLLTGTAMAGKLNTPKPGNFELFKDADFSLQADFQASGVFFSERDLNGFNGTDTRLDTISGEKLRTQTNEIEMWMYHELTLNPSIEFYDGTIGLHMELYTGGYVWENDVPNRLYTKTIGGIEYVAYDYEKFFVKGVYLEAVTPIGFFLIGRIPPNMHGFGWGMAVPQLPDWSFVFMYSAKNEGTSSNIDEKRNSDLYTDTVKSIDYRDRDDQTILGFTARYNNNDGLKVAIIAGGVIGGSKHTSFNDLMLYKPACTVNYDKDNLHVFTTIGMTYGLFAPLSSNETGKLLDTLNNTIAGTTAVIDPGRDMYREFHVDIEDLSWKPGISFGANVRYDTGDYSPEIGLVYLTGADHYYDANQFLDRNLEPEGNRTKEILKSYLFSEIEDKYRPLIATFATDMAMNHNLDAYSYHNMTAIKLGTTYRLNPRFKFYGQVLAAWRENVKFFEKDYWDLFSISYLYPDRLRTFIDDSGIETMELPLVFQNADVDYYQKVDPFLGYEVNGKFTYLVKKGLEIALIGAYFKPGDFYQDILTAKQYTVQWINFQSSTGNIDPLQFKPLYGPYLGADEFQLKDAYTVQLKFEFKFQ